MANTFNASQLGKSSVVSRVGKWFVSPFYTWEVTDAKSLLQQNHNALKGLQEEVEKELTAGNMVSDKLKGDFETAARNYNNSVKGVKYATHGVGATMEGMFKRFGETLGLDTTKWGSTQIKGDIEKTTEAALQSERGFISRVITKPFRLAHDHSKPALILGGLLAVAGIGNALHKRAERRTQEDAMQQAALLEEQMHARSGQVPMAQATTVHVPQQQADMPFPATSAPMIGSSTIAAGNDNVQHQGMVANQQRLAAL